MISPLVSADGISFSLPSGRELFSGISFAVENQELLLITGPNGSGKSTLVKLLIGEFSPSSGKVQWNISQKRVAYLPQLQNMEFHLPLSLKEAIDILVGQEVTDASIARLGLLPSELFSRTWNGASGGEKQRTLLTAALLSQPAVLILDEPFNHLDLHSQELMIQAIDSYLTGGPPTQRAVMLVSHVTENIFEGRAFKSKRLQMTLFEGT